MAVTQNTRINTLIMRGLSATAATAQAQREARKQEVNWTTHRGGGYVIHADAKWVNGNSPVGLALAVRLHKAGSDTPSHVIHPAGETCGHCPAGS